MTRRWLAILILTGCQGTGTAPQAEPAASSTAVKRASPSTAIRVETATVHPESATMRLTLPGEVEGFRDARLAASLGGYIEKISVKSGDAVRQGQILALVDTATHGARRNQAKVELDNAKRELDRAEKAGSALAKVQLDTARARVESAKAALRSAEVQVSRSIIQAPFAGVIVDVAAEVGEVAPPGAPILRLVQLDPIKVTVSLSDRDVKAVSTGMKANVRTDANAAPLEGTVDNVAPAADLQSRSFLAEVSVPNPERVLLPGMIATVEIAGAAVEGRILLAQDWIVTRPDELGVFVNDDGTARWRRLDLGPLFQRRVLVDRGLGDGDEIVITGHRELADGDRLLISRRGRCCREGRVRFDDDIAATPAPPASSSTVQAAGERAP